MIKLFTSVVLLFTTSLIYSQQVTLSGFVFDIESNAKLDDVQVNVSHEDFLLSNFIETDYNGFFKVILPEPGSYQLEIIRPAYERLYLKVDTKERSIVQVAVAMKRLPGYEFNGTLQEFIGSGKDLGEEIKDAHFEAYNQTTGVEEMNTTLTDHARFKFNFERGNRYTFLIRKKGFFAKRFDVMVNIDGCVLCFEGLGSQHQPEILESLTEGNQRGILLASIPFRKIKINEAIRLENIYYDYDQWNIRTDARKPLNSLVQLLKSTPIVIELGSHTDSRGKDDYNQTLSQKRAQSAVDYIISRGIDPKRITAAGYGESQLTNRCDDGNTCSEREHQANRRTEFKVTRLMTGSSFDRKSLVEIIEAERAMKRRSVEIIQEN